ncbi:MAG: hypothetical protein GXC76_04320 [Rhodanobacteraceae bacterium]|jgi:hypothetical protein|nr:hypothetical protein [Rhodanobacteraceae bacterium]
MMPSSPYAGLPRLVADLCRLRRGPQDLPYSPPLFAMLAAASIVLDLLIGSALGDDRDALARSLVLTGLVLGLCWAALAVRGLEPRYVQTASALLACSVAISLLQWAGALLVGPLPAGTTALDAPHLVFGWLTLGLFVWQVVVYGHIMRQALDMPSALALLLVLIWIVAAWALDRALFGAA